MVKVREDLTGHRFGKITVVKQTNDFITSSGQAIANWDCICDCNPNKIFTVTGKSLKNGHSTSCGCNHLKLRNDLIGKKFGKLTVVKLDHVSNGNCIWECECECGNISYVRSSDLNDGSIQSCGCLKRRYNEYNLTGDYGIGLTHNTHKEFYFDLEDYNKIKNYCWREDDNQRIITSINENVVFIHRMILDNPNNFVIDHKNHNPKDNRKNNLRICTQQQNNFNQPIKRNNTSGITGVSWAKREQRWRARIHIDGKDINKYFKNFNDAVKQREEWEDIYFKEFSYKNSIKEKN